MTSSNETANRERPVLQVAHPSLAALKLVLNSWSQILQTSPQTSFVIEFADAFAGQSRFV
jgi:hypothetical protein